MYCTKCGAEINDEAVICPKCGCETGYKKKQVYNNTNNNTNKTLRMIAKIFMLISTIAIGFLFFILFMSIASSNRIHIEGVVMSLPILASPLAWCIPMTVHYWKKVGRNEPVSTAFKVCTLIFVNMVAGILMLCDNND